jgi:putative nucleotidyltransferase with HDIG domain
MTGAWRVTVGTSTLLILLCCGLWFWPQAHDVPAAAVLVLAALALLTSAVLTRLAAAGASVSLTSILLGAAIPLSGPLGAAVVGLVSALDPVRRRPLLVRLFNVSMNGLVGVLGGLCYIGLGGVFGTGRDLTPVGIVAHQLVPLACATIVMLLLNTGCVSLMIQVNAGPSLWITWRRLVRQVGRTYLGYGVVGFLFAVLWDSVGLGPTTVLVMVTPLALAQWSYVQQHAESVAHERTVSSLVAAVDARDPIMRGRNERVANVSELIGNELRLSPAQADALHFAALLHDVGMVAPIDGRAADIDVRQAHLDRIRRHPERGVEMLRSIGFLEDSITAIRHHHERWDGRGYPSGLAGEDIPQLARVLAVADAFCALVPRVGATAAVDTLTDRAGTQFDPACVTALCNVATSAERLASLDDSEAYGTALPLAESLDHDLPEVSDLLVAESYRQ